MKSHSLVLTLFLVVISIGCNNEPANTANNKGNADATGTVATTNASVQTLEASCGQCQFEMEGDGCDLAVRIDGKSYYVDGANLDGHGDAHGDDGMCNCIRHAKVTGEVKDGRFVATSFELLPQEKKDGAADEKSHDDGDKEHSHE